jgi:hypothetical protein
VSVREAAHAAQDAVDPLLTLYRDAHLRLKAEQDALVGDPLRKARVSRLLDLQERVRREMDRLDRNAGRWIERHGGETYASGFVAQPVDSTFTLVHRESARRLADDMFDDLLSATRYVRNDVKRFIQEAARIAAQSTVVDNTAKQAGRDMMKDLVDNHGIRAVRYANGAQHPLGEYSQMTIRTKTALAFNQGGFDAAPKVEWWECFDGPNCGLTFHEDGEMANGLISDRLTARAWPISHPNCRRSWAARPDIDNKTQAGKEQATRAERLEAAQHAVGR